MCAILADPLEAEDVVQEVFLRALARSERWFGCYGTPRILFKADRDLQMAGRYAFEAALGIAGAGKGHLLIAKGPKTEDRRHQGTPHRAVPDPENGLRFEPLTE